VSTLLWGALLGGVAGAGLLLVVLRISVVRRPQLADRVLPCCALTSGASSESSIRPTFTISR
jgi:hypothetical protein